MTTDKTPATLAVDVLAVMDRLRSEWRDESQIVGRWDSADALDAVRSAVAELIEAVEAERKGDYFDSEVESWSDFHNLRRKQKGRVAAALARVKGESA